MRNILLCLILIALLSCNQAVTSEDQTDTVEKAGLIQRDSVTTGITRFRSDLEFLQKHQQDLVVLSDEKNMAQVIISPAYQGRVMTSTAQGNDGMSFGWLNYDLIASGKTGEHIHAVGGEERFWLGPEGGQFSLYFKKGKDFVFDNWFVPKEIDTEPFKLVAADKTKASFTRDMHLENYSGNIFDFTVNREVRLLDSSAISKNLGFDLPSTVSFVGFESANRVTNTGSKSWTKNTGLLSIWMLNMLNASSNTNIIVPYKKGDSSSLGKIVTDDYFGKVPADRLRIDNGFIIMKADANWRSKIGISPHRAISKAGSYDAVNEVLTIVQFSLPANKKDYVNSLWKIQDDPFAGDAVNAYNDGPIEGKQMGKFYELESSSPAAALKPGDSILHIQRTIHFHGSRDDLNKISLQVFGVSLDNISK